MFFTGTLQEGIASAIQQGKSVFCFVTDGGNESLLWENEFLTHDSLEPIIRQQCVTLKLQAGSEEAGYLAAIFPLPKNPTVVIIKNGDLKGYITTGTTKDDFISKVATALGAPSQPATSTSPQSQTTQPAPATQPTAPATVAPQAPVEAQSSSSSNGPPTPTPEDEASANVRSVLAERRARLEAQRLEQERKAKEARAAKAAEAATDTSAKAVESRKHAEQLRKQRQDAADERARILRRIEDDKRERQARSAAAKQQAKLGDVASSIASVESSSLKPKTTQAAIQVRLLDGSSLKTRFEGAKATLKSEVRKWVDESRTDGNDPYVFKVLVPPPMPSRKVDETEEGKTLMELGLAPSATLVLVPVTNFAEAYVTPRGGYIGMLFAPFGFVAGFFAWFWGLMMGVFTSHREERQNAREESNAAAADAQAARVREKRSGKFAQFANPDDRKRDQQLYNGNSLNFEPRKDDEEEKQD